MSEDTPSISKLHGDLYMKSILARSNTGVEQRFFLFTQHRREDDGGEIENSMLEVRATDGIAAWTSRPLRAQDLSRADFGSRIQIALEALTPSFPSTRQFTYTVREIDDDMQLGIHFTTAGQAAVARLRIPLTRSRTPGEDVQAALSTLLDNFRQLRSYTGLLSHDMDDLDSAIAAQQEVRSSLYEWKDNAGRQAMYEGITALLNARKAGLNRLVHRS